MTEGPEKANVPRRLAAILAADIAGYSALMGADESDTVCSLKEHQAVVLPMIKEHGVGFQGFHRFCDPWVGLGVPGARR
jgi:class 3 adenylate cyclase